MQSTINIGSFSIQVKTDDLYKIKEIETTLNKKLQTLKEQMQHAKDIQVLLILILQLQDELDELHHEFNHLLTHAASIIENITSTITNNENTL